MAYTDVRQWQKRTKQRLIIAFGGACQICGYNKCERSLCLHHLNPEEKEFTISGYRIKNWDKIVVEAKKCILLCHNCHNEVHDNITKIPDITPKFDEKCSDYKELEKLEKMDNCPVCQKLKSVHQKTCSKTCSIKQTGKVKWDDIDLINMIEIQKINMNQIAKQLNISWNAVKKRYAKLKLLDNL